MKEEDLIKLMDEYGNIAYKSDLLSIEKQKIIDSILTPEIKAQLDEISAEFSPKELALAEENKQKKKELDKASEEFAKNLQIGKDKISLKSSLMTLTFYEPEVIWNVNAIDAYAIAGHPEILSFRKVGNPKTRLTRNK